MLRLIKSVFFIHYKKVLMHTIYMHNMPDSTQDLVRKKTKNDILQYKYVYCNRAGEAKKYNVDTSNGEKGKHQRKKASHMSKCPARICFKVLDDGSFRYGVNKIEEMHNHELYTNTTVHMAKHKRKWNFFDMTLINQLSQKNIGASKAHHMIGDTDANILVELMNLRKENVRDFSFVHLLEDSELRAVFWADNVVKRNYKEFSDIVSFDATYHTNKYNLVFVPFTRVDNHKKSVTLGGALLARETAEYYTWLLKSWLDAFGKQPVIVVTDQEAAVVVAVEKVFTNSIHRLCMWHIGKKFTQRVDERVIYGTDFKLRLQRLIWNNCHDPTVFEFKWNALIEEFDLTSNKWLKDMKTRYQVLLELALSSRVMIGVMCDFMGVSRAIAISDLVHRLIPLDVSTGTFSPI
ncbi:hypothetical protein LXL04_024247 [Taraxacum kok-saghyz]